MIPAERVRRRNANSLEGVQFGHMDKICVTVTIPWGIVERYCWSTTLLLYVLAVVARAATAFVLSTWPEKQNLEVNYND